ncbi:hypothetical protein GCM10010451_59610 [Streptomyces virens]|uniref:Uncharacterized protein n=1 Tax=Streptomyces virens TaxID=285572 RepID=A0ABP6Q273_9ACTN
MSRSLSRTNFSQTSSGMDDSGTDSGPAPDVGAGSGLDAGVGAGSGLGPDVGAGSGLDAGVADSGPGSSDGCSATASRAFSQGRLFCSAAERTAEINTPHK